MTDFLIKIRMEDEPDLGKSFVNGVIKATISQNGQSHTCKDSGTRDLNINSFEKQLFSNIPF